MAYWINTVSHDHVKIGVAGGFTQANHGKSTNLKRLNNGDWIAFYSPRTSMKNREPLQEFTALVRVVDERPYQVEMTPDFHPWRRRVELIADRTTPIRPLIDQLSFIEDKARWGYPFRQGLFRIPAEDFALIAAAMGATAVL
ncbi:MAG: EVE domain-containing protein [Caldilineaceae bacterium]|nr:EVE domain-containing protein [Caldilineaceae bacterium]